jgi:hypothetical protein
MCASWGRRLVARSVPLFLGLASAILVVACGKVGGDARVAGVYRLPKAHGTTSLELREDGTFTLHRMSCESSDQITRGDWKTEGAARIVRRDVPYWPTPDTFPSTVVRTLTLRPRGEDLIVVGESEWAGTFTQKWLRGRPQHDCGSL